MLVAGTPKVPSVATHDFLGRQINAAIHRLKNVRSNLRKVSRGFSSRFRLVILLAFFATGKCQAQGGAKADSDPGETEKIAFGLEEHLHRSIIDISPANRRARQFWNCSDAQ